MRLCWGDSVGGRAKCLGGLLLIVGLAVVLVIVTLPRLSILPRHVSPPGAMSPTATQSSSTSSVEVVRGAAAADWGRLATFYVLTGRKDDHNVSAQLAEAAGDCRTLPAKANASVCGLRADIYLLYADTDELRVAEAARNVTRCSTKISVKCFSIIEQDFEIILDCGIGRL